MTDDVFVPPPPLQLAKGPILISLDRIDSVDRIREVSEAGAAMMADSLAVQGLISPIVIRPVADDRYRLVVGGHRLAGARLLGWDTIRCDVRDLDDVEAENIELRENLDVVGLTKLDQMVFMARRAALDALLAARPRQGGDRQSAAAKHSANVGGMVPRLTQEMADQLGRSERAVQRAIQIAEALDRGTIAILRGTRHADNQQALLKLSQERNPAKQRALAQAMRDGARTMQAARVAVGDEMPRAPDPYTVALAALHAAWTAAATVPEARLTFLSDVGAVFVSTAAEQPAPRRRGRRP